MKIAIIGNGQSALNVSTHHLLDKDLIVRLKLGAFKPLYPDNFFEEKEHHVILHPYNLKKLTQKEVKILSKYKKIFFISFSNILPLIRLLSELEFKEYILPELNIKNLNLYVLSLVTLFKNNLEIIKDFDNYLFKLLISTNKEESLFVSSKMAFSRDCLLKLKSFKNKRNEGAIFYPSVGFSAILTYLYLYPNAKIYLYGYDFNNDSGWFWSKEHKHNKFTHNFAYEKEFILKTPLFSNVNIM